MYLKRCRIYHIYFPPVDYVVVVVGPFIRPLAWPVANGFLFVSLRHSLFLSEYLFPLAPFSLQPQWIKHQQHGFHLIPNLRGSSVAVRSPLSFATFFKIVFHSNPVKAKFSQREFQGQRCDLQCLVLTQNLLK